MEALSVPFDPALPHHDAPLQRLDARVKLILVVLVTSAIVTTPIQRWPAFVIYASLLAAAIYLGRVPVITILRRLSILLPFLILSSILVPLAPPVPGTPTGQILLLSVIVKSLLGAAITMILIATTPFPKLLAAMETLHIPRVAVMIFSFTHRYLFVLHEEALRMMKACQSRCYRGRWLRDAVTVGQMAGTLFLRSYERGERVYLAMLARGFDGSTVPLASKPRMLPADYAVLFCIAMLVMATWTFARLAP
jgi:cobalt/nickel transport system permease protein